MSESEAITFNADDILKPQSTFSVKCDHIFV